MLTNSKEQSMQRKMNVERIKCFYLTDTNGEEIHVHVTDVDHPCSEKGLGWMGWEDHAKDEATAMGNPLTASRSRSRAGGRYTEWVERLLHYWRNRAENVMPAKCSTGETRSWIYPYQVVAADGFKHTPSRGKPQKKTATATEHCRHDNQVLVLPLCINGSLAS